MLSTRFWISTAAFLMVLPAAATAHSIGEVEAILGDKEKYFQPIDKPAPDFALRTADGNPVRLADLRRQVVVLYFIYTNCPDVCPLHSEKIAEVQGMINDTPMRDLVTFVAVTTDPVNDTADVLRDYGPARGIALSNFLFLTKTEGQPEDVTRSLAEAFGHRFIKSGDGYQTHGIVTHVIDKDGRWRANFHGLKFEPVNLLTFVNALTNDTVREHGHEAKSWRDKLPDFFTGSAAGRSEQHKESTDD